MRVMKLVAALCLCGALTGCAGIAMAPVVPPQGLLFSSTSAPFDVDFDRTQLGSKRGTASTACILGLIAFGDPSTQAAARSAGITTINHADYHIFNLLWLYSSHRTVVYGDWRRSGQGKTSEEQRA